MTDRQSNIELLRISSMLIILIYHFLIHSIKPNSPHLDHIITPLITVMHIGVICFVLITGYWGISFSLKRFMKLFLYCSFYSVLIYLAAGFLDPTIIDIKGFLAAFIPYQWWFIPVYLSLFILAPIINIPLKTAKSNTKLIFIVLLLIISFGLGQIVPSLSNGKNPLNFILIYYIGDYLRTVIVLKNKIRFKKVLWIYIIFNLLLFIIFLLSKQYFQIGSKILYKLFFPYNSIGLMINSILFFLIFTQLAFKSKLINWFASSALAVYLVHENKYIGKYIYEFVTQLYIEINNIILFSISIISLAIMLYIIISLLDKLLSPLFELISKPILESSQLKSWDDKLKLGLDSNITAANNG